MQSFILVIFGATGDLAHSKLIPALYSLFKEHLLPDTFFIIGFARRPLNTVSFRELFSDISKESLWNEFAQHLQYQQGSFDDEDSYRLLIDGLLNLEKEDKYLDRIFYLATPPLNYLTILKFLHKYKKSFSPLGNSKAKLVIEKPFGKDLDTAIMLDKKLFEYFQEWQIFRVDHYLGKETVQNILVFRFSNSIFEPVWNSEYIDHFQITFAEKSGIQSRGKFFDGVGILRDVTQNHLLQLLAAVAMEQPTNFSSDGVRDARAQVISEIKRYSLREIQKNVVRGQYYGYLTERDISHNSHTETFVALKLFLSNDRFKNIPFYIRAGKKLKKSLVEVSVIFKQTCHVLFKEIGCPEVGNVLTFYIQPDEGIGLKIIAKKPGSTLLLGNTNMHFLYDEEYHTAGIDAYQKILIDIFLGDQMLFNRSDELGSSWEFITSILKGWEQNISPLYLYDSESWGPQQAMDLIEQDGRRWIF